MGSRLALEAEKKVLVEEHGGSVIVGRRCDNVLKSMLGADIDENDINENKKKKALYTLHASDKSNNAKKDMTFIPVVLHFL
ncbi:hypothetical protein VNO78_18525 [Psophocarpus tetragonolobus]|uniref:Uncharacterized protein n=1 Tax=Psophocarpus tetragonolobus TaxID=3891 RepID=A0AAN9SK14_PSOTE